MLARVYGVSAADRHPGARCAAQAAGPRLPKGIPRLEEGQADPPSANWLLDAKDDRERFRRIQICAGGTYEQMWQIGYRYEQATGR
jgi:hypothetical protein